MDYTTTHRIILSYATLFYITYHITITIYSCMYIYNYNYSNNYFYYCYYYHCSYYYIILPYITLYHLRLLSSLIELFFRRAVVSPWYKSSGHLLDVLRGEKKHVRVVKATRNLFMRSKWPNGTEQSPKHVVNSAKSKL